MVYIMELECSGYTRDFMQIKLLIKKDKGYKLKEAMVIASDLRPFLVYFMGDRSRQRCCALSEEKNKTKT